MIGLDTCTIIDLFQGDKNLIKLIKSLDEEICLSKTSYFELIFGINPKNKNITPKSKVCVNLCPGKNFFISFCL